MGGQQGMSTVVPREKNSCKRGGRNCLRQEEGIGTRNWNTATKSDGVNSPGSRNLKRGAGLRKLSQALFCHGQKR